MKQTPKPTTASISDRLIAQHKQDSKRDGQFWNPTVVGELLAGTIVEIEYRTSRTGRTYMVISVQNGEGMLFWAPPAWMSKRLAEDGIEPNDMIVVEFQGTYEKDGFTNMRLHYHTYPAGSI
jgi:hypothetical protein